MGTKIVIRPAKFASRLTRGQPSPLLVKADQPRGHDQPGLSCISEIQHLPRLVVEITEAIGLNPISDDRKQQMPRQMYRRRIPKHTPPARSQALEVETAQMRDLVFSRCPSSGRAIAARDAAIAMLLSHDVTPRA
jgi:hypothetical protein